jgi:aspartate oxidase
MVAEQSMATVQWTIDELGVKYKDRVSQVGGHSVPRMYSTYNQSGSAIVTQQLAKLKALVVEPRLRCFVSRIFREEGGRVKGVEIREGYVFPKADSGKVKTIKARKAVVLASGGFGEDPMFRKIQDPRLDEKISHHQPARSDGRGLEGGPAYRLHPGPSVLDPTGPLVQPG